MKHTIRMIVIVLILVGMIEIQFFSLRSEVIANREMMNENTTLIQSSTEVSGTIVDVLGDLVDSIRGEKGEE